MRTLNEVMRMKPAKNGPVARYDIGQATSQPEDSEAAMGGISRDYGEIGANNALSLPSLGAETGNGTDRGQKSRLKIVVYAISKNESKFVERWMRSMQEADAVVVMDTGSTDTTVDQLRDLGAEVEVKPISPWRFDVARNESIAVANRHHPDADILVCTDLDEYFVDGWRDKVESAWSAAIAEGRHPTTATYEYVWNFNPDGSDGTKFAYEKIHDPKCGARWTHPCHEVLSYPVPKVVVNADGVRLEHHADPTKSRGAYLGLLEMSVREDPEDDRNTHYLGRELMFHQRWQEAIGMLNRHLGLPRAQWRAERAASMRYISRCYGKLNEPMQQELWLWKAVMEDKNQREACVELAELMHQRKDWQSLVRVCEECLNRKNRCMSYLTNPEAWGSRPWDLYAIGLWWTGRHKDAIVANAEALLFDPDNKRIKDNQTLMERVYAEESAVV